jgi:hypothetical protein
VRASIANIVVFAGVAVERPPEDAIVMADVLATP